MSAHLTDAEKRTITGTAQRCLAEGETGMTVGDCNRAGWHLGQALTPVIEAIVAGRMAAERAETDCGSCGESPENECSRSRRPCGHHCNHTWTHDRCDWCGVEFGENGEPHHPPASGGGA